MTGNIHIADVQGDTTRTWDTADPETIRAVEEIFREAQVAGRLVYRADRGRHGRASHAQDLEA
jgi:hypothetical protein